MNEAHTCLSLEPIAYAENGFSEKFGIPRQSRPDSKLLTRIIFAPAFRDANMLRGIEGYSHLWLLWGFSESNGWHPTVRPPRLGGNERMGVFATRSPFRPNPIGLTSVELVRIEETQNEGHVLLVRGADLLSGTPIYDIKPYLSFSDSHPDARNGFAEKPKNHRLTVVGEAVPDEVREVLEGDPRPGYQNDPERIYHITYAGHDVAFRVEGDTCIVEQYK